MSLFLIIVLLCALHSLPALAAQQPIDRNFIDSNCLEIGVEGRDSYTEQYEYKCPNYADLRICQDSSGFFAVGAGKRCSEGERASINASSVSRLQSNNDVFVCFDTMVGLEWGAADRDVDCRNIFNYFLPTNNYFDGEGPGSSGSWPTDKDYNPMDKGVDWVKDNCGPPYKDFSGYDDVVGSWYTCLGVADEQGGTAQRYFAICLVASVNGGAEDMRCGASEDEIELWFMALLPEPELVIPLTCNERIDAEDFGFGEVICGVVDMIDNLIDTLIEQIVASMQWRIL